jgi:hypothetical protein
MKEDQRRAAGAMNLVFILRPFTGGTAVFLPGRRVGVFSRMIARLGSHGDSWLTASNAATVALASSSFRPYWNWFCLENLGPSSTV